MSLAWLLCLLLLMVIPAIMLYVGNVRKNLGSQIGAKHGYTTQLSLSSPEAWAHAQAACIKPYTLWGVILTIVCALLMLVALGAETVSIFIYAFVLLLLELLVWGIVLCTVESNLRKLLGVKES